MEQVILLMQNIEDFRGVMKEIGAIFVDLRAAYDTAIVYFSIAFKLAFNYRLLRFLLDSK